MSLCRQRGFVVVAFVPLGCSAPASSPEPAAPPQAPAPVASEAPDRIVEVVAGPESTCARSRQGRVACVGHGMAYDEDTPAFDTHVPQVVAVPPSKGISAGDGFACSVDRDGGKVRCWGDNRFRQLGRKTPACSTTGHARCPGSKVWTSWSLMAREPAS